MKSFIKSTITAVVVTFASSFAYAGEPRTSLTAEDTRGEVSYMSVDAQAGPAALRKGFFKYNTQIEGVLSFPGGLFSKSPSATNKVPAVVLMHGSNGPNKNVKAWADYLNGIGVATFRIDGFSGRGIKNTGEDQSQMTRHAGAVDALLALKLLATHPFIDAKSIAVMGFSRGGTATQAASYQSFHDVVLGADNPLKFAGHIAFYGGCAMVGKTTGAPILVLTGEADDRSPVEHCRFAYDVMKSKGANVKFVSYPDAHHGFDEAGKVIFKPNVQVTPTCRPIVDSDTEKLYLPKSVDPMQSVSKKEAESYSCEEALGGHSGGNSAALAASKAEVASFIDKYLR